MADNISKQEKINICTFGSSKSLAHYTRFEFFDIEKKLVKKYFKPDKIILDLGCAIGRTSVPLAKQGLKVIAVDIVPEMINVAKKLHPDIDFRVMDAANLQFSDNKFDYIFFSFNGLDYLYPKKRRTKALLEIYRCLKPNGIFIFSSHNSLQIPSNFKLLNIFILNLFTGKLFTNYRHTSESFGKLITYHSTPFSIARDIKSIGFREIYMYGRNRFKRFHWLITLFFDNHPSYVCKK